MLTSIAKNLQGFGAPVFAATPLLNTVIAESCSAIWQMVKQIRLWRQF
jgi:hypothetical protein